MVIKNKTVQIVAYLDGFLYILNDTIKKAISRIETPFRAAHLSRAIPAVPALNDAEDTKVNSNKRESS
jgi:hypothetical protein